MNELRDYAICCNAFVVDSKYYIKEITIIGAHIRHHFRVKIPKYILRKPITRKERDSIWYCEQVLHGNLFENETHDCSIRVVTSEIRRLQSYDPDCIFYVKGDSALETYLRRTCRVRCLNLITAKCEPSPIKFKFYFCPHHTASQCSYYKAASFFNQATAPLPYKSRSDRAVTTTRPPPNQQT